jgi:hypothetical protein
MVVVASRLIQFDPNEAGWFINLAYAIRRSESIVLGCGKGLRAREGVVRVAANFQVRLAPKHAADPLGHHRMLIHDDDAGFGHARTALTEASDGSTKEPGRWNCFEALRGCEKSPRVCCGEPPVSYCGKPCRCDLGA